MTRQRGRGFTLIELLVVTVILAVGLASISALFVAGIVSSRKAERITDAVNVARRELERLRSAGFSSCTIDPIFFPSINGYTILQQNLDGTGSVAFAVPNLPNGQGTIDITFYDTGAGIYPNLKDIKVTITWTGGAGTGGTKLLRTLISNHP